MLPGALVTVRTRPDSVAANTAWSVPAVLPPPPDALNHTSSPPGVQCAPKRSSQPARYCRLRPGEIDDGDVTTAVDRHRVLEEGDAVALRRHVDVAEPAVRPVEHPADRKLEGVASALGPHDGQRLAVWRPVGGSHVLEHLARSAAANRQSCQHGVLPRSFQQDGHLAVARHGLEIGLELERAGLGAARLRRVDLERAAFEVGGIDDGAPVGREPRERDRAAPERERLEARPSWSCSSIARPERARRRRRPALWRRPRAAASAGGLAAGASVTLWLDRPDSD